MIKKEHGLTSVRNKEVGICSTCSKLDMECACIADPLRPVTIAYPDAYGCPRWG